MPQILSLAIAVIFPLFYSSQAFATKAVIESPRSTVTGIGLLYGWACDANEVSIYFENWIEPYKIYYGMERYDTRHECGDTNNGFYVLMNWNILGDGEHTVYLYADGTIAAQQKFNVITPGEEFLRGVTGGGVIELSNGLSAVVEWSQSMQNFRILEFIDTTKGNNNTNNTDPQTYTIYVNDTLGNRSRWIIEDPGDEEGHEEMDIGITPLSNNGFYLNAHLITFRQNGHVYDSQYFFDGWLWHDNDGIKHLTGTEHLELELQDGPFTYKEPFDMYYNNELIFSYP